MKQNKYNIIGVLNVFLAAAVIFIVIYYVAVSNVVTASSYRIDLLNEELSDLIGSNGVLTAKKMSIENSSTILDFAEGYRMVEAKRITHIFESGDVALKL